MDSNEFEEIRFLGPGFNWGKIQGTIAVGVGGGDSPLPAGTRVSAETYDPGKACMQCPKSVVETQDKGASQPYLLARSR